LTHLLVSQWIVTGASLLITIGLYDQALKIWRTKSAKDFTTSIVIAIVVNEIAWLNYGLALREWPIVLIPLLNIPAAIIAAVGYFRFRGGSNKEAVGRNPTNITSDALRVIGARAISSIRGRGKYEVKRELTILEEPTQEKLWHFYSSVYKDLNQQTPLNQSLDKNTFLTWLVSGDAVKFIVLDESNQIHGFSVLSSNLEHDPINSTEYWMKVFPGKSVYHFPAICFSNELRKADPNLCLDLMKLMMAEIPLEAVAVFLHSEEENPLMPRLVRVACGGRVKVTKVDAMACQLLEWSAK